MLRALTLATIFSLCVLASGVAAETPNGPVTFEASDGGTVYADFRAGEAGAPVIVLFHQARANGRAEYESIAPRLAEKGYHLLIVDQRSGGRNFGGENRTVEAHGRSTGFCAAYPDAEGALAFAKEAAPDAPVFVWGSSYSGALTMKLAAEHGDDITGALVFSPASGRSTNRCRSNDYADQVTVPVKAFAPRSEMGRSGEKQRELFLASGHAHYVAENGVHGSSMLDPLRAKGDPSATWAEVFGFLEANTPEAVEG
ncbi:MAG: alpha/beta fold hydrolase [Pseudomonadota bacterium]